MTSKTNTWLRVRVMRWRIAGAWSERLEMLAVVLLTTASLATAWNGYQATQWGGIQSKAYSQASAKRVQATEATMNASLDMLVDVQLFHNYAAAYSSGNTPLMDFLALQFSDRLRPAVEAWRATDPLNRVDAPNSPFEMPEYVVPERERASQLTEEADALFAQGVQASDRSSDYVLNSVYFALVLFFAGIASKVRGTPARAFIIVLSIGLLIFGGYHVGTLPTG